MSDDSSDYSEHLRRQAAEPTDEQGGSLLTGDEHRAVQQAADLWNTLNTVVAAGDTRQADLIELSHHIHAIQNAVLAQAAARAHPDLYRPLGDTLRAVAARGLTERCGCGHRLDEHGKNRCLALKGSEPCACRKGFIQ